MKMKKMSQLISTVFLIMYLMSPVDVVPDVVPIVGWMDDPIMIIVLLLASGVFEEDKPTYRVVNDDNKYLSGD